MYELIRMFEANLNGSDAELLAEEEFEKMYSAPAEIIVLLSIFYGIISFIAIVGNTLVIWVVATTRQMHTVTNMYIANLAFADVIIGMFCIPFQFQAALLQKWHLPEFMCAFCPFVQAVSVNVSVFTLTAIAVDRHRAIINPLRARPTRFLSKMIILGIWIAAFSFAIPFAVAFRVIKITERFREGDIYYNITRPFCENVNLSEDQLKSYRYYLVFVQYVVPFCVISFVYIQMAVKLWGSRTPGNAQDARDRTLLINKKKVIKMLIIVVVVFGLCWLPLQAYNILYVTWSDINEYRFINIIWFCCDWLAMSNSCYNPFIYGIYNEKFKREFNKRFTVCLCKFATNNGEVHDRTASVYTRASSIRSTYGNASVRTRNNCFIPYSQQNQLLMQQNQIESNLGNGKTSGSKRSSSGSIKKDIKYNPINFFGGRKDSTSSKKSKKNSRILFSVQDSSSSGDAMELVNYNDSLVNSESLRIFANGYHSTTLSDDVASNSDAVSIVLKDIEQKKTAVKIDGNGDGLRKHVGRVIDTNRNKIDSSNSLQHIGVGIGNEIDVIDELKVNEIYMDYPFPYRKDNFFISDGYQQ